MRSLTSKSSVTADSGSRPASQTPETDSLDPADWVDFRALSHRMLDEALDHLQGLRDQPVWREVPPAVKSELQAPVPLDPQGAERVCDDFRRLVLPYATGNSHPRFFGWVHGSGTPGGMLAEMLAAALNANLGGRDHAPVYVERQVIDWSRRLFGFPDSASGLLVSGTSMATLIGLTVARNHLAEGDLRQNGFDPAKAPLMAYCSAQSHSSIAKACEILGLGRDRLRDVPVDAAYQMDCAALEEMIARDKAAGLQPFCVIGTAGTVNTGAIDDLTALADICAREALWFHIDGAFGAAAMLSDNLRPRLAGIERADSLAFDFHKWLHVPYDAGCILVRDEALHRAAFSSRQEYLAAADRGLAGGNPWFCEYGPELSRGFRALKVWFTLKEQGIRRLGEKVEDNCAQARDLAARVDSHPDLELMAPVGLNIVCFRFAPPGLAADALDRLNNDIVIALQEQGIAAPSTTRLKGAQVIRVNITNHRSRSDDFDILLDAVLALGREFLSSGPAQEESSSPPNFRLDETAALEADIPVRARELIEAACKRPELRLLSNAVTIAYEPGLPLPFQVLRGDAVILGPGAVTDAASLTLHLRHAFELALLHRLTPGAWTGAQGIARALLAARTAGFYERLMTRRERRDCARDLPDWLRDAFDLLTGPAPWRASPNDFAAVLAPLVRLQGQDVSAGALAEQLELFDVDVRGLLESAAEFAVPSEHLLTTGGDQRLETDPDSGLNAYGCSPRPRPWAITFASSTATSISDPAYRQVERLRQRLIAAALTGDPKAACRHEIETVKSRILRHCGAADLPGCETILAASGTDAELFALPFVLAGSDRPLVNIVIAPDETGSGLVRAAGGRHFAGTTALGRTVEAGAPLSLDLEHRVRVETLAARDAEGRLKPLAAIDAEVESLVREARGARCLVHLLDASKTGWGAPSLNLLERLRQELPDRFDVVVDACQMRAGPAALRAYLDAGFLLQVTGSKFFTGPPFAGALILAPAMAARANICEPLPSAYAAYAARADWPRDWEDFCGTLTVSHNSGLLGRWTAALWEMEAFHAVPESDQIQILTDFGTAVRQAMAANSAIAPCVIPTYDRQSAATAWDRLTTIFPFAVLREAEDGTRSPLNDAEMRRIYHWLNRDISGLLPDRASPETRQLAAKQCHIGQPVKLRPHGEGWVAALRLNAGARIVSGVAFDPALGANPAERLQREIDDARLVFDKVSLILERWRELEQAQGI